LIEAASLLWLLNQLASAIRWTYQAGHVAGTVYWRWLHPLVVATWAGISWTWSQIDWRLVGAVVLDALKVLIAFTITAARASQPALVKASACLGRAYSCLLVEPAAASLVAPAVNPLMALAEELEAMTCSQLRQITGTRSKLAKRQLVAIAVAC
jgi:hypothetical protein